MDEGRCPVKGPFVYTLRPDHRTGAPHQPARCTVMGTDTYRFVDRDDAGQRLAALVEAVPQVVLGGAGLVMFGMASNAVITLAFVTVGIDTSPWVVRGLMLLRGLTLGFGFIPLQAAAFAQIRPEATGRASAVFQAQFRGIKNDDVEQFKQLGKQIVVWPDNLKQGNLITPFDAARKAT